MADRSIYVNNGPIGLKDHVGDESVYSVEVWLTGGSINLEASDIEIGAVEIKDGDSDVRLDVEQVTSKNAAYTQSEAGAHVDLAAVRTAIELIDHLTAANAGNADANTQRVVIASDQAAHSVKIDQTTPGTTNRIDIGNIANTTQTNDVKVTLDNEVVALGAGEAHAGEVGGRVRSISTNFTRPADTTAYAAKDAVSDSTGAPTVLTYSNVARIDNGSGYIVKARLMSSGSANTQRFRLHLFHTTPVAINDNSPYTLLYANAANRLGAIDFPALNTEGTGSTASNAIATPGSGNLPLAFVAAAADRNLYSILETLDAFTPASAQTFFIELSAELD